MSLDQLSIAILAALAQQHEVISSIRLAKLLGVQQSTLLRALASLAGTAEGQSAGLGWVSVQELNERKLLSLTALGQQVWSEICEAQ